MSAAVDLSAIPVVDGHCHPLLRDPAGVSIEAFLDLFSEGRSGTMRDHLTHAGYYRRALRALAGRLGVDATAEAVLEARRRQAGPDTARAQFAAAGIAALLVDTGYPPDGGMPLVEMRRRLGCAIHEVFRIETCAERLLIERLPYHEFLSAFRRALLDAAPGCVAFKTIVAYRTGLAVRPWSDEECGASYARAIDAIPPDGRPRLADKPLLDRLVLTTLEVARETGRPLQIHSGFGDPDIDLLSANPLLLRPILEDARWASIRLVLLHMAYPYTREAAFMTAVWPQVCLDLSLALPFLGAGALAPLIEILSLAPSSKLLYGSDVSALPELFALSAEWGRSALGEALGWLVDSGDLQPVEAVDIGRAILSENARALYALPEAPRTPAAVS
jgi:predicted TIM-barrel fold metal-dependent hydrolase